eukprot:gene33773-43642_t
MNITVAKEVPCANINSEKPFDQWFLRSSGNQKVCHLLAPDVTKLSGYSFTKHSKKFDIQTKWHNFTYADCIKPGAKNNN